MEDIPNILAIAGSDSGGGAGIQADLKSASALGVYAATAITAITAQNTRSVDAVAMIAPEMVRAQIRSVLSDLRIDAVKIGMLGTAELAQTVADALVDYAGPIVLDPVMVAKSGDALLAEDAVEALITHLLPRATLLTPNLPEASRILGATSATTESEVIAQGERLRGLGAGAVLMKGGHGAGETCVDLLISAEGTHRIETPRLATRNTHGTGCSLSSAIAAGLAQGRPLPEAVDRAQAWLHGAIRAADRLSVGSGHGPVHHFHGVWS